MSLDLVPPSTRRGREKVCEVVDALRTCGVHGALDDGRVCLPPGAYAAILRRLEEAVSDLSQKGPVN